MSRKKHVPTKPPPIICTRCNGPLIRGQHVGPLFRVVHYDTPQPHPVLSKPMTIRGMFGEGGSRVDLSIAFPNDTAPRWLLRDRDRIYGEVFQRRLAGMGIAEVVSAPASPWQNPYAERLIGSIRPECLDHVIVMNAAHLRRVLTAYSLYYHRSRTHLGLEKDTPDHRPVSETSTGPIVAIPEVGGLHHRYERRAA